MTNLGARIPSKRDVVVLALADLGAASKIVDTEDVAIRAHELAPKAFSWRKYQDQIDLDSVRVSLTDACKPKYGALAAGSVKEGWHLTPAGVSWHKENSEGVRTALITTGPTSRPEARLETLHAASEITRVRAGDAFRTWEAGRVVPAKLAAAAFRIDAYTSERERNLKVNHLAEIAEEMGDADLREFVRQMTSVVLQMPGVSTHTSRRTE